MYNWDQFVPMFRLGSKFKGKTTKGNFTMGIDQIAIYVILGELPDLDSFDNLNNKKLWTHMGEKFTMEYCREYVEMNKKPEENETDTIAENVEEDLWVKRQGVTFRTKMFALNQYKQYFNCGDSATKESKFAKASSKSKNPTEEEVGEYINHLDDMSTAMMESALYLRYQMSLLTRHEEDDTTLFDWRFSDAMNVLHEKGGKLCQPFFHPTFADNLFRLNIDPAMDQLALVTLKKAKRIKQDIPKPKDVAQDDVKHKSKLTSQKTVCGKACEGAFNIDEKQYTLMKTKLREVKEQTKKYKERAKRKREEAEAEEEESDMTRKYNKSQDGDEPAGSDEE